MSFPHRPAAVPIAAAAVIITIAATGCVATSTYDERLSYLRKVANRGVDTYRLLYSQEARIDKARCERAFEGSAAGDDMPATGVGTTGAEWRAQVKEFFVDSCISGKPKPVPRDLPTPSTSSTTAPPPASPTSSTTTS